MTAGPGTSIGMTDAAPYLDPETFAACVEAGSGLAVVDFTAAWCPFQDGEVVDRIAGALPPAQLRARIQAARRPPDPLAQEPEARSRRSERLTPPLISMRCGPCSSTTNPRRPTPSKSQRPPISSGDGICIG